MLRILVYVRVYAWAWDQLGQSVLGALRADLWSYPPSALLLRLLLWHETLWLVVLISHAILDFDCCGLAWCHRYAVAGCVGLGQKPPLVILYLFWG